MTLKGLVDQNYSIWNGEIAQANIEPSPNKVSFTVDGSTEDKTKTKFYKTSSLFGAQDTPGAKVKLDLDSHNKIDSPTMHANPEWSLTFVGTICS